jgi:hypothetical protein
MGVLPIIRASALLVCVPVAAGAQSTGDPVELQEVFRLGGLDASPVEEFTNDLLSLSVGPNDQLFVLDFMGHRIEVFSAQDGRHVRTISRSGRGPGEITEATALGWDRSNNLWVSEPFVGRFSQFDSTGNFIQTVRRDSRGTASRTGKLQFDQSGRLIEVGANNGPTFLAFSADSGEVLESWKTIPEVPRLQGMPPVLRMLPEPARNAYYALDPRAIWDWAADGTVWMARSDRYRILEIAPDGDTVRVFLGPPERDMASSEEEAVSLLERVSRSSDLTILPPQIQGIVRLDDGHVVVQVAGELNAPGRLLDVFEPDGRYIGRAEAPIGISRLSSHASDGNRLYLVGLGEFDVPVVVAVSLEL